MRRVAAVLLVAGLLAGWPVGWSLTGEEVFSAGQVGRTPAELLGVAARDRHPPLHFLVIAAVRSLSATDWSARLPSGVGAVVAVAATAAAARRLLGPTAVLPAAVWMATAPVVFVFAHTARMYGMMLGFSALALLGAARVGTGARGGGWLLALGGLGGLYTHYAAVLPVAAAFAAAAGAALATPAAGRRPAGMAVGAAGAAVALGFAPWAWGPLRAQLAERVATVERSGWPLTWVVFSPDDAWHPLTLVAAGAMLVGLGWLALRRPAFVVPWILVAVGGTWALSSNEPMSLARNYLGLLPMFVLAGAGLLDAAASRLRVAPLAAVLPALVQVPVLVAVARHPYHPQDVGAGHDYRVEGAVLDALIPMSDAIVFEPSTAAWPIAWYAPGLLLRTGEGPRWGLRLAGRPAGPCGDLTSFRVRMDPPAEACASVAAALDAAAEATGYPALLLTRAARRLDAGEVEGARADVQRALQVPPRGTAVWDMQARVALAARDPAAAEAAWREALRLGRAYAAPGRRLAGYLDRLARAARRDGDVAAADRYDTQAACARARTPAWACLTILAPLTLAASAEPDEE